jgi:MFS family permease
MCPFITQVDTGMVNLALPSIAKGFGITSSAVTWISSLYIVLISATVLLFGKLGDSYGHFKVLKTGMIVFTIATIFSGLSKNLNTLLVARVFQAIGASASLGNTQGTITRVCPPKECGKAFGINACSVALGTLIGPSVGGFILTNTSWNMLFFSELPLCILIIILQMVMLKNDSNGTAEAIDWKGSAFFFITIACFFISLQQSQKLGISNPLVYCGLLAAVIFLFAFVNRQKHTPKPLLDLGLFTNKLLVNGLWCTVISYSTISAFNLILPFYFQNVREMTASESGLILSIYPLLLVFILLG